jgi:hypothetical protein
VNGIANEIVMKYSTYLSIGFLIVVILWVLSGALASVSEQITLDESEYKSKQVMKVQVIETTAEEIKREIVIQGELER